MADKLKNLLLAVLLLLRAGLLALTCVLSIQGSRGGQRLLQTMDEGESLVIPNVSGASAQPEVLAVLHHGCTRMEASGSYTHGQKSVLICVVNRHQAVDFQNILKKYDKTFSFSETVSETYGNFKHIK